VVHDGDFFLVRNTIVSSPQPPLHRLHDVEEAKPNIHFIAKDSSCKGESTYEVCSKADERDKRVVSIDDIKEYHPRVLRQPRYVNLDDLPLTGESHGWNEWTEEDDKVEAEIEAILDKRVWNRGTGPNETEYLVRYKDDPNVNEWIRERDLFAPDLLAAFLEKEQTLQLGTQHYKTTRSGTRKRALDNA
jgi:hypothetical protein